MAADATSAQPLAFQARGFVLQEPPPPQMDDYTAACKKPGGPGAGFNQPGCALSCITKPGKTRRAFPDATAVCSRCECQLCAQCSKPVNRYSTPLGQVLETVTTRTEPRFTFAYNPYDDDMKRMRKALILEPMLTHAWHEATARCCNETGGLVVDVGGNFGWYTLYSLALGCRVAVFEPVPTYREVMQLGIALNPGFAERVTLYGNVVYDQPGNYTLRVPIVSPSGRMKKLGMTGMKGSAGVLKADWRAPAYEHTATSVRLDDVIPRSQPICMVKADVEGYEPQVLQTARRLLTRRKVPALQLELTKTPKTPEQTCAAIKMLEQLHTIGFRFKQVSNRIVDSEAPRVGSWATSPGPWGTLPSFPSSELWKSPAAKLGLKGMSVRPTTPMTYAYRTDFRSFSTNLIAMRDDSWRCGGMFNRCPEWPRLGCK